MRHAIAAGGLIYHLDVRRTVEPKPAHLLESVFSRQRDPSFDTMGLRTYSDKFCVIGEIDLSHLCRLRSRLRFRFSSKQIDVHERQPERDRDEQGLPSKLLLSKADSDNDRFAIDTRAARFLLGVNPLVRPY